MESKSRTIEEAEDEGTLTMIGTPVQVAAVIDLKLRSLLYNFESLGVDCEFGLLQRRYGAEPLGLLRWSFTTSPTLINLLTTNFDEVGCAASTELFVSGWNELMLHDTRYKTRMHTFVANIDVNHAVFLKKQCQRLAFLADKLRDDLVEAEKIFVYSNPDVTREEINEIRQIMKNGGNGFILTTRLADSNHPPGTVEIDEKRMFTGFLKHYGITRTERGNFWNIDFDSWISICRTAYDIKLSNSE